MKPRLSTPSSARAFTSSFQDTKFSAVGSTCLASQAKSAEVPMKLGAVPSSSERYDSDAGGEDGSGVAADEGRVEVGLDMVAALGPAFLALFDHARYHSR